jgi:S-formylglutathione hydrolase FrmB
MLNNNHELQGVSPPQGKVFDIASLLFEESTMILRGSFFSQILEMETGLSILIPNRTIDTPPYRVAYLLHGLCGRNGDWLDYTMLPAYAEVFDIMFIMPEVARSFYTDMVFGQKFFTYIHQELPVIVKKVFNISAKREDTLVIGASMGGYGALKCALSYPDQYGYCAAFSSACLFLKEGLERQQRYGKTAEMEKQYGKQLLNDFESIFGQALEWKPEYELLELAKSRSAPPRLYLACGTADHLKDENQRFSHELEKLHIPHRYEEWPGGHDWNFFNKALEKALRGINEV